MFKLLIGPTKIKSYPQVFKKNIFVFVVILEKWLVGKKFIKREKIIGWFSVILWILVIGI